MIFVDTETGTWGNAAGIRLLPDSYADSLDEMSDSEINEFGLDNGWHIQTDYHTPFGNTPNNV